MWRLKRGSLDKIMKKTWRLYKGFMKKILLLTYKWNFIRFLLYKDTKYDSTYTQFHIIIKLLSTFHGRAEIPTRVRLERRLNKSKETIKQPERRSTWKTSETSCRWPRVLSSPFLLPASRVYVAKFPDASRQEIWTVPRTKSKISDVRSHRQEPRKGGR